MIFVVTNQPHERGNAPYVSKIQNSKSFNSAGTIGGRPANKKLAWARNSRNNKAKLPLRRQQHQRLTRNCVRRYLYWRNNCKISTTATQATAVQSLTLAWEKHLQKNHDISSNGKIDPLDGVAQSGAFDLFVWMVVTCPIINHMRTSHPDIF